MFNQLQKPHSFHLLALDFTATAEPQTAYRRPMQCACPNAMQCTD